MQFLGRAIGKIRHEYRRQALRGASGGARLVVHGKVHVSSSENIRLGSDVVLNEGVYINASYGVEIGDGTHLSAHSMVLTEGLDRRMEHQGAPIRIGKDVWICAGAIILPGVAIGDGAVVAAGAVVLSDVRPNALVAGVPAEFKKDLSPIERRDR
jgi:maltose O-acetyltransferase